MVVEYPTDLLDVVINYIFICFPCYCMSAYVFCKVQGLRLSRSRFLYTVLSGMLFTALFVFVRLNSSALSYFFYYALAPVLLSFISGERERFYKVLVIGLVSISLVFVLGVVSIFINSTMFWVFHIEQYRVINFLSDQVMMIIFCVLFLRIKRFRRGFQYFQDEKNLGIGIALSAIVMVMKCLELRDEQGKVYLFIIFIIGITIAGFGLYLWIRRSITVHYRERLQLKSEEHYKEMLEDRDKEIEKLHQSNEYLAKVVHRDNHLMNAVNTSVNAYFDSDKKEDKDRLLRDLQTLTKERAELINQEQLQSKLLPSSGNLLIDRAINDLYIKATSHGIDFNLTVSTTVDEVIGKYISQTNLQTMLSDHIKDAIIAVESRGEKGGKILVNLSTQNNNYCIDFYDNGVDFDVDTLSKLGLERVTTHADTGGSGIGFVTTFETLKKAYASLIITEFENQTPFTKSVSFRFDGEGAFIIYSYRSEILKASINRNDMIIVR